MTTRCVPRFGALLAGTLGLLPVMTAAAEIAGKRPADYQAQIVRLELQKNPNLRDLNITCADPVRVLIHGAEGTAAVKEMTVVAFTYSAYLPDGSPFFFVVQGAALFDGGALVKATKLDDPLLEWVAGRPQPHADTPEGKNYETAHRFLLNAIVRNGPVAGPIEHRRVRRDIWLHYNPAILEMAIPAEKSAKLQELLVAREEAPFAAGFAALQRGVDPFSAAMAKVGSDAKVAAEGALIVFLGEAQLDRLEYLSAAIAYEFTIRQEVGLDLEDAGIPLSPSQLLALGKIYADILAPKRNPDYKTRSQYHDPVTGLWGLHQSILDRSTEVLSADQREVFRSFLVDRAMFWPPPWTPPDRSSLWLLHQPFYGPGYRRSLRHQVMRNYLAPVADLGLPKATEAKVKDLLVQRNLAPGEAAYVAEEKGLDRPAQKLASQAAYEEAVQQLKAVLGEADYQRLEGLSTFERIIKIAVERREAAELEVEGCPLTRDQLREVQEFYWKTYTEENPELKTLQALPAAPDTGLTALDKVFLDRTATILSARQQQALRTYREDLAFERRRSEEDKRKQKLEQLEL